MSTSVTVNGKTYDINDFIGTAGRGYNDTVTAGTGEALTRFFALIADTMADASRVRQTTSATSKNAGLSGSQSWVLAQDLSFAVGGYVLVAQTSAPTTNFYIVQVTGYVSGTKTLTGAVQAASGSTAGITDWTLSVTGKPNPAAVLPVDDNTALVKGSADATKQVRMEADGLTTGTTRVLTVPDKSLTLAGLSDLPVPNRLINGSFAVSQRAVGTTDNSYTLDRWRVLMEAATACTVTQDAADVPTRAKYAAKLVVGAANNNKFGLFQPIEGANVYDLRGQSVSVRVPLKATAGIADVRIGVAVWTGTEDAVSGDPVSAWNAAGTNPTLAAGWAFANTPANVSPTTAWADYLVENVSVPAGATNLALMIWCDDKTTTATTDILRIGGYTSLALGAAAGPIGVADFGDELRRCQRYFQKTFPLATAPAQNAGVAGAIYTLSQNATANATNFTWHFAVRMRTAGTLTTYNPSAANANWRDITAAGDVTATSLGTTEWGVVIYAAAAVPVTNNLRLHAAVDSEL